MLQNTGFEYGLIKQLTKTSTQWTASFENGFHDALFGTFTVPPVAPNALVAPADTKRLSILTVPTFTANAGSFNGQPLHYILQIATDNAFSNIVQAYQSLYVQAGWKYLTPVGQVYSSNLTAQSADFTESGSWTHGAGGAMSNANGSTLTTAATYTPQASAPVTAKSTFAFGANWVAENSKVGLKSANGNAYELRWQNDNNLVLYKTVGGVTTALKDNGRAFVQVSSDVNYLVLTLDNAGNLTGQIVNFSTGAVKSTIQAQDTSITGAMNVVLGADSGISLGNFEVDAALPPNTWFNVPASGVPATATQVQFTPSAAIPGLVQGTPYYWRMNVTDGGQFNINSVALRSFKWGSQLLAQFKNPVQANTMPTTVIFTIQETIPTDGTTPASRKIYVCNNGFDANPTWEDATSAYMNRQRFNFMNTTKTATNWGVNVKYQVDANDSIGVIQLSGLGVNFS